MLSNGVLRKQEWTGCRNEPRSPVPDCDRGRSYVHCTVYSTVYIQYNVYVAIRVLFCTYTVNRVKRRVSFIGRRKHDSRMFFTLHGFTRVAYVR